MHWMLALQKWGFVHDPMLITHIIFIHYISNHNSETLCIFVFGFNLFAFLHKLDWSRWSWLNRFVMLRQLGGTFVGSISPRAFLSLSLPFSLGLGVSKKAAQLGNRFRLTLSPILYPYTVKPGKVNYVASVLSTGGVGGGEGGSD